MNLRVTTLGYCKIVAFNKMLLICICLTFIFHHQMAFFNKLLSQNFNQLLISSIFTNSFNPHLLASVSCISLLAQVQAYTYIFSYSYSTFYYFFRAHAYISDVTKTSSFLSSPTCQPSEPPLPDAT